MTPLLYVALDDLCQLGHWPPGVEGQPLLGTQRPVVGPGRSPGAMAWSDGNGAGNGENGRGGGGGGRYGDGFGTDLWMAPGGDGFGGGIDPNGDVNERITWRRIFNPRRGLVRTTSSKTFCDGPSANPLFGDVQ